MDSPKDVDFQISQPKPDQSVMENVNPNIGTVQHVPKSSSDRLLTKFAEVGSKPKPKVAAKKTELRLKKNSASASASAPAERNSLLPPRKPVTFIRRFGKCKMRLRELKTKSIVAALQKTWRNSVEGASRVLMEKHYNRHKRLISDLY